jgi:hypothetical protein
MKTIAISLVSLLVGIGVGWHFGYTRAITQAGTEIHGELDAYESGDAKAAAFAAEAIRCIDSGETQKAVQFLSLPIASYYSAYAIRAGTNAQRLKLRAYIEQTAQTNQVVAAQIKKEMSR